MVYIFAGTVPAPCLFRVASGPNVLYAGRRHLARRSSRDTPNYLVRASRLDMSAWLLFLQHFNGRSLLDERRWTQAAAVCLETDASAGVFREVRPSADAEPTSWDWADFAMLQT
ncbi:hypothetical protein FJT64_024702 [Amphibalanus amphitrite]|uniref:Uncharacterized protein n=1 Tax=Amphibalanus amphitrite TaxID=1232801 RepID=A0A6A4VGR4_AMPAM|nr:hypothetical protein FJT64_008627 [Amphibalanus amphitrite]KAF0303319.1 hypothetical protein FJT64_024702 [Amphibalanus amphitrite]